VRARGALATLYHSAGRTGDAERVIAEMLTDVPAPDSYALAVRLWTSFGNVRQAQETRAEGRRVFAEPRQPRAAGH
jgi:hypothetical protein